MHDQVCIILHSIYHSYAAKLPTPAGTPMTEAADDNDSDGVLGAAAARPIPTQASSETLETRSKLDQWRANEGGPGKKHHPLIWWKVRLFGIIFMLCITDYPLGTYT
jgi:hypothetical protein